MRFCYRITNTLNGKIYIGQTADPKRRWKSHQYLARRKPAQYIGHALAKYGIENFIFEVIATCQTLNDSNSTEIQLIARYNSCNKEIGYNISPGGSGVNLLVFTEKHRRKLSEAAKGRSFSEETREKISEANTGKIRSEEVRNKISEGMKKVNRKFSDEVEEEMMFLYMSGLTSHEVAKIYGCNFSTVVNIAKRHGCVKSSGDDKKGKPSNRRGKKHSPESIKKMSEAKKKNANVN